MNRANAKIQKPITFKQNFDLNGADHVISQSTKWLRHGLEFKMVPLVEFCLTYLVCVRPMDLNTIVQRQDGVVAGPSTHAILNRDDCFALAVKISSKQRKHQREKPAPRHRGRKLQGNGILNKLERENDVDYYVKYFTNA